MHFTEEYEKSDASNIFSLRKERDSDVLGYLLEFRVIE